MKVFDSMRNTFVALVVVVSLVCPVWSACPEGDITGDCKVDFEDLQAMAAQWLYPAGGDSEADLDGINGVESRDFALLAGKWYELGIPLVINELLASNDGGARDPQNEDDDWIEIYNAGDHAIDVGGMHLTDNLDDPNKWQIPDDWPTLTTIDPGEYLVIWADNDVDKNPVGLHAGFELSAGGEEVGLYANDGTILVDSVEFPDQETNISYGRYPDGSDEWRLFSFPSPGSTNIGGYAGLVSDVKFSHERGFYDEPILVTIACDTEGAGIYYSIDGEEPGKVSGRTVTGIPYTGPISITGTTCLRAVAVISGWKPSAIVTQTYLFIADIKNQSPAGEAPGAGWPAPGYFDGQLLDYGMDPDIVHGYDYSAIFNDAMLSIPSVSLVTELPNLFDYWTGIYVDAEKDGPDWERPVSVELINPDGSDGFQINAGLRIRGGYSRQGANPKHAFRLLFGPEYGGELEFPLFGDEGVDKFSNVDLRCSQNYSWSFNGSDENSAVREVFSRDTQGEMGHPYTRSRYYHLYLNGHYWGLYQTQERSEASFAESYMGGSKDDYDVMKVDTDGYYMFPTDGDSTAYRRLYNAAITGFGMTEAYYRAQGMNPDGTPNPAYERMLDTDNLIDYMIIEYYTGDRDGPGSRFVNRPNNTYCIYNRENPDGWKSLHHDNEHTLGVSSSEINMVIPFTSAGSQFLYFNPHWLHERLATQSVDYRMRFADHVYKHFFNGGLLTPAVSQARINKRVAQIELAIIGESARWGDAKRATPFTRNDHWQPEINELVNVYIPPRTNVVLNQFKNVGWYPNVQPPVFSRPSGHLGFGSAVGLSGAGGIIYYTDDGSDPRQPGGGINTSAQVYTEPIDISVSSIIKARIKTDTEWSPLAEAVYGVGPVAENLRITELMYHPMETGDPEDPNREFIELTNIGSDPINLNMVRFTKGISFTFGNFVLAPGQIIVLVRDEAAFLERYQGFWGTIGGEFDGKLDNGGERIRLEDALGQTILDFKYKDGWYDLTDGQDFSLTITDPADSISYEWDTSLASYWNMNDGPGATATDSVGGYDGTLYGDAAWAGGRIDGALALDGSGDYAAFPSHTVLTGVNVTVTAWVWLDNSAGSMNPIVTQHDAANIGYRLQVALDQPSFGIIARPRGATVRATSPDTITKGQWHHIAGTNDGANLSVYVDGVLKATVSSVGYTGVASQGYIGYETFGGGFFNGMIDDVRIYDDVLGEYELAIMADPTSRWSEKESWRASAYVGGSPGWDDNGIIPNPGAIVVNEVLAHSHGLDTDWVEFYNTTDANIDIGGWYLSDSGINLRKYRIALGTEIPAHGYLLFYEHLHFGELSSDPGKLEPFALSENGDHIYLTSTEADVLTGYRLARDFGASETGVSFGRYYKGSTGDYDFVSMQSITPGWPNSAPLVGPVVISEIMYNPDWPVGGAYTNDQYEYVELHNIAPYDVALYDSVTGLPWKLTNGVEFTFPVSPSPVTIPAGGYLTVVLNPSAFAWRYPTVPTDLTFGPYDGRLNDGGEKLELSKPGDRDKFGRWYYILVDKVNYSDGSHHDDVPGGVDLWPVEADRGGKSLNRITLGAYGNDPNNWEAATPSPAAPAVP
ncbi:MAG: lamin tail domain-containing protein [Sedimentisphaerales bacterium]|nr:lamin tail domain-containing protein [Sedimentisphaerales bacterium]